MTVNWVRAPAAIAEGRHTRNARFAVLPAALAGNCSENYSLRPADGPLVAVNVSAVPFQMWFSEYDGNNIERIAAPSE
jgi:hypothetical protein